MGMLLDKPLRKEIAPYMSTTEPEPEKVVKEVRPVVASVEPGVAQQRFEATTARPFGEWNQNPNLPKLSVSDIWGTGAMGGDANIRRELSKLDSEESKSWQPMKAENIDPLVLRYPGYAKRIAKAREMGMGEQEIDRVMQDIELELSHKLNPGEVNFKLGRTEDSMREMYRYTDTVAKKTYLQQYGDLYTEKEIEDRIAAAPLVGVSPNVLLADSELYKKLVTDRGVKIDSSLGTEAVNGWKEFELTTQLAAVVDAIKVQGQTPELMAERDRIKGEMLKVQAPANPTVLQKIARSTMSLGRQQLQVANRMATSPQTGLLLGASTVVAAKSAAPLNMLPGAGQIASGTVLAAGITAGMGAAYLDAAGNVTRELESAMAYDEYIESGVPHEAAFVASEIAGMVSTAIEFIPLQKMLPYIPGMSKFAAPKEVADRLVKMPTARGAMMQVAKRFALAKNADAMGEAAQELTTILMGEFAKMATGVESKMTIGEAYNRAMDSYATMWYAFPLMIPGVYSDARTSFADARYVKTQIETWAHLSGMTVQEFTATIEAKNEDVLRAAGQVAGAQYNWSEGGQLSVTDSVTGRKETAKGAFVPQQPTADFAVDPSGVAGTPDQMRDSNKYKLDKNGNITVTESSVERDARAEDERVYVREEKPDAKAKVDVEIADDAAGVAEQAQETVSDNDYGSQPWFDADVERDLAMQDYDDAITEEREARSQREATAAQITTDVTDEQGNVTGTTDGFMATDATSTVEKSDVVFLPARVFEVYNQENPGRLEELGIKTHAVENADEVALSLDDYNKLGDAFIRDTQNVVRVGATGRTQSERAAANARNMAVAVEGIMSDTEKGQQARVLVDHLENSMRTAGRTKSEAQVWSKVVGAAAMRLSDLTGLPMEVFSDIAMRRMRYDTWLAENPRAATFNHPANADVNPDQMVPYLDLTNSVSSTQNTVKALRNHLRSLIGQEFISSDALGLLGVRSGNYARHIVRSSFNPDFNNSSQPRAVALLSLDELIGNSVLIESFPNQDRAKRDIETTHRFYTPVRMGDKLYTVRIVAHEKLGSDNLSPVTVDVYDVIVESNTPSLTPTVPPIAGRTTDPVSEGAPALTIREMLSGVKDSDGSLYFNQAAYHGTPHRFDRFSTDHIGSGEGEQAFGWGLYFAGDREVSEWYRKTLTSRDTPTGTPGQLFKVDIPESDVLLDWDKPLSEQSKTVREAVLEAAFNVNQRIYEKLSTANITGEEAYYALSSGYGSDEAASKYLNQYGVQGIQYLDGSSRADGEGTHNYVIFDDEAVRILDTYYQSQAVNPNANIQLTPGLFDSVINFFETANKSSSFHEYGHHLFNMLAGVRQLDGLDENFARMIDLAFGEMGVTVDEYLTKADEKKSDTAQEKFARTWETYLATGKAPSKELQTVFGKIRSWLIDVYRDITQALGIEVSETMKNLFDTILATPEEQAAMKTIVEDATEAAAIKHRAAEMRNQARVLNEAGDRSLTDVMRNTPINTDDMLDKVGSEQLGLLPVGIDSPESSKTLAEAASDMGFASTDELVNALIAEHQAMQDEVSVMAESVAVDEAAGEIRETRANAVKWIKENGRINLASVKERFGPDAAKQLMKRLGPGAFSNKTGRGLDEIAADLQYEGFPVDGGDTLLGLLISTKEQETKVTTASTKKDLYQRGVAEGVVQGKASIAQEYAGLLRQYKDAQAAVRRGDRAREKEVLKLANQISRIEQRAAKHAEKLQGKLDDVTIQRDIERAEARHDRAEARKTERRADKLQDKLDDTTIQRNVERVIARQRLKDVRAQESQRRKDLQQLYQMKYKALQERQKVLQARARADEKVVRDINRWAVDGTIIWSAQKEIQALIAPWDLRYRSKKTLEKRADIMAYLENPENMQEWQARRDELMARLTTDLSPEERVEVRKELAKMRTFKNNLKYLGTRALNHEQATRDALYALHRQVKEVHERGKAEYVVWKTQREEARSRREAAIFERLKRTQPKFAPITKNRADAGKQYSGVAGHAEMIQDDLRALALDRMRLFNWFDGDTTGYDGPMVEFLGREWDARTSDRDKQYFTRKDNMDAKLKELGFKVKDFGKEIPKFETNGVRWTWDEAMHLYIGMKNQYNRDAILYGTLKKLNVATLQEREALINRVISKLSDKHKQAAELVVADFDANRERISQRMIETTNKGFDAQDNYISMLRMAARSDGPNLLDADAALSVESAKDQAAVLMKLDESFTISRREISPENQQPIVLGLFSVWASQMAKQEHTAAMTGYAQDVASLIYGKNPQNPAETFGQMITERFGKTAWRALVSNENVMIRDGVYEAGNIMSDLANRLSGNTAQAALAYNVATAFKQSASFPRFLPYAGFKHLTLALGDFISNPNDFLSRAFELDPQLRSRAGDAGLQLLRSQVKPYMEPGFRLMAAIDRATASIGFVATYEANKENGLSHERAISEAQRAVNMTQIATTAKDKAYMWKQHAAIRAAMLFTGDASKRWNISTYDMGIAMSQEGAGNKIQQTVYTSLGWALGAMMAYAVSNGLPIGDSEQELDEWLARCLGGEFFGTIPLIGSGTASLYDAWIKGSKRGRSVSNTFFEPVERLVKAGGTVLDALRGRERWYKGIWYPIEAMSYIGGKWLPFPPLPTTAARRLINASGMLYDGELYDAVVHGLLGRQVRSRKIL